ncbi:hypothetical protein [Halobiforma nitratireducens]|uniref:Uncharacterized protein n=1 Tax=Halobiforma nitratireducens JCM 10879 TaxID=1227454 RepID=M0MB07_9EURY|nr:hypothetical protein [Halobiforma nitratireducens]EMA41829.1 hypothetical protein C446_05920 [Halobiforma nitratireducens JCM 10879]
MTDNSEHDHEYDSIPGVSSDELDRLPEDADGPIDAAVAVALGDRLPSGADAAAAVGGGLLVLSALRSLRRGQLRAIPKAAGGVGLLAYAFAGSSEDDGGDVGTFEPDVSDVASGTEGKTTTDQAHAAGTRPEHGRGPRVEDDGSLGDDDGSRTGTGIEFTDDGEAEPRSKPGIDEEHDPRRNVADDEDEGVQIDVSDTAMADEASEAAGPDPEQAQPAQTDATEPEETPEEDASHMKVEPDEDPDDEGTAEAAGDEDEGDADDE